VGIVSCVQQKWKNDNPRIDWGAGRALAASDSHVLAGWTLGVGGEWLFNKSWSGGLEYRHTDLGAHSFNIGLSDASLVGFFPPGSASVRFTEDQVTARLNYHFH